MTFLSLFIYVKQLESCILPLANQSRAPVKGTPPINHREFKKWIAGDLKRGVEKGEKKKCPACRMPHQCLTEGFSTLQSTAIHSGAILSAFFSFISKLLKTTLWIGRWSMSFLLHAISQHPCPPPPPLPAYIHTSFNSNRKSKWKEKGEAPDLSISPVFPLKINHRAFSLHQDRYHLYMPRHPSCDSDNTLLFCAE